jgi:DNA polymerase-3 subunit alpha
MVENVMETYFPLHLHTTYSTLDSCIKPGELADRLVELSLPGTAITEHGNLHSLIECYKKLKEKNLQFICGMEAYLTHDSDNSEEKNRDNFHLVLLCKDTKGLENLIWLSTQSYLHNFYYKPRIWMEHFREHSEGLIALSACLAGIPSRTLRWEPSICKAFIDNYEDYIYTLSWFREIFKGDYYLEIQDHDFWQQKELNRILIDVARRENFPLVITTDAHYIKKEDSYLHEMMMAMQFKQTLEEYRSGDNMKYGGTNYIPSYSEMRKSAEELNVVDALENTVAIAEKCKAIDLKLNSTYHMPTFNIKEADDYEEFKEYIKTKGEEING